MGLGVQGVRGLKESRARDLWLKAVLVFQACGLISRFGIQGLFSASGVGAAENASTALGGHLYLGGLGVQNEMTAMTLLIGMVTVSSSGNSRNDYGSCVAIPPHAIGSTLSAAGIVVS